MNNTVRALSVSMILILSSLAGCLSDDETTVVPDENNLDDLVINYGTVMVSTYHVGELVSAVAGDSVTLEYMSQDNIPVHDYEPSAADLIRLQEADLFFYHGLNLEPWVDSTLSSLGDDAPPSYMTHTMPSGESDLAYESMLVSDLCELMTDGPFESTTLGMMHDDHDDHDDHGDDDHDDHGDDDHDDHGEDDHDDHGDDDHGDDDHDDHGDDDHDDHGDDDHDEHDDHEHAEAEMAFENPEACPADTSIQVFHMEEGEHILEFESEHDEDFNMAVLKMLGGHAHHDHHGHGHGSGPFEWAGIFEMNDATHTWSMQKVDGDYADPTMRLVLIPTDTPTEETMHGLESGVEALIEGDCTVVEDGETMSSIAAEGSCFELHVGTGDDSTFTIDTDGITGMSMYAQHVPTEFERDQHYLKDSAGTDIEPVAQEGAGAHGDHGDHGDDHGDDGDEIVAGEGEDAFTYDPHSWLSPIAFEAQLNLVLDSLSSTFPDGSELFTENAASYSSQLMDLHERFTAAFGVDGTCDMAGQDKTIVANHNAYSYMSVQYDIDIITLHGLDPEGEPSPADIAEVVESIEEKGITVLFVEEYTDQTAVNSIVEQTGVSLEILYTMEMAPSDSNDDYLSMMNKNLENIVSGCGC